MALAAASLILTLFNGRTLSEIFLDLDGPTIGSLVTWTVSFSVVGALIASHRPENLMGWIFLAIGFFYGLLIAGEEYAIYALLTNPGSLPFGAELSLLAKWIWAPGLGLILVFLPLLFPDGNRDARTKANEPLGGFCLVSSVPPLVAVRRYGRGVTLGRRGSG
jgi:hypothetical protein